MILGNINTGNNLRDVDYRQVEIFKSLEPIVPSDILLTYRRGVFIWGGFMLFVFFAGLSVTGFEGIFIKGNIQNTSVITILFGLCFYYYFVQYVLQLNREFAVHSLQISMDSFCGGLNLHLFRQELKAIDKTFDENNVKFQSDGGGRFGGPKEGGESVFTYANCLDYIVRNRVQIERSETLELISDMGQIRRKYRLDEFDKRYFEKHYDQLKNANLHDFMQFKMPVLFGGIVLVLIVYSIASTYTGAPAISSFISSNT